jgi:hypothetical protein
LTHCDFAPAARGWSQVAGTILSESSEAELRSKAPQRVEVAPQQPEFLAALLARADQAVRQAQASDRPQARAAKLRVS